MMRRFFRQLGMRQKAEHREAIIRRDQHHSATRQALPVKVVSRRGAGVVAAAVKPDHHRPAAASRPLGGPYVQEQTVFAARCLHSSASVLRARRSEGGRLAHAGPGLDRGGLAPAQIADGSLRERDALEHGSPFFEHPSSNLPPGNGNRGKVRRESRNPQNCKQDSAHRQSSGRLLYREDCIALYSGV